MHHWSIRTLECVNQGRWCIYAVKLCIYSDIEGVRWWMSVTGSSEECFLPFKHAVFYSQWPRKQAGRRRRVNTLYLLIECVAKQKLLKAAVRSTMRSDADRLLAGRCKNDHLIFSLLSSSEQFRFSQTIFSLSSDWHSLQKAVKLNYFSNWNFVL